MNKHAFNVSQNFICTIIYAIKYHPSSKFHTVFTTIARKNALNALATIFCFSINALKKKSNVKAIIPIKSVKYVPVERSLMLLMTKLLV